MPSSRTPHRIASVSFLRALLLTALALSAGANALAQSAVLSTNGTLQSNQFLQSNNNAYKAVMQADGNFCVQGPAGPGWCSGSKGAASNGRVMMQGDGNLCISNASGSNVWCNSSNGNPGDYFTILRDSGDLEVYRGKPGNTAAAVLVWTSGLNVGYYVNRYADLKQAFGSDARRIMDHWITYGQFEGRAPREGVSDDGWQRARSVNLETKFYAEKYPDLKQAFGYDAGKLYEHWMNYGMREARVPNKATDDLLSAPPRSANGRDVMRLGDWLQTNEYMASNNKRYILVLQSDANLVVYETQSPAGANGNNRRWYQNSKGFGGGKFYMRIQADGHFCTYRGTSEADQGEGIACTPSGAGGPVGRYFLALQDDGNVVVYKGNGPADNRGWIWDRITTKPSSGFNFNSAVESVKTFVVRTANSTASGATGAANTVASGTVAAANALAREATSTANIVANGTVGVVNQIASGTVDVSNKVANTTQAVAVTVGNTVVEGGQIVGQEVVNNGQIVGYAVARLATDGWNYLNANCGSIGRKVFPIDKYFQGAIRVSNAITAYGTPEMRSAAMTANQCFDQAQDGFYCAIPEELGKIVSQAGQMPGNMLNLGTRVFNEAKSKECLIAGAATVGLGATGLQACALGKVLVSDAQKAYACFTAAEAKGVMKKFLVPGAASEGFPSPRACRGLGKLAFSVAEKVVTDGMSSQAKAAIKAGKGRTVAVVAEELRSIYTVMSGASKYDELTNELASMPECRD